MSFSASRIPLRPLALVLVLASATSAALVGCGGTAEDEAPTAGTGGGSTAGTGGSAGAATAGTGGTGGAATGGTAGAAGGATAGSGGNGLPDVGCDYTMALTRSCAITGCHNSRQIAGDLDLTPDAGFRDRLLNVTATHSQIICDVATGMECVPAACPTTAKLLDTANPSASWIWAKLGMTPTGCGDQMPLAPGNAADRWTEQNQACLVTFFTALAGGGPPAGSGGTGAGGSSGGSAGSATAGSTSSGGTSSGGNGGVASGGAGASSGGNAGSMTAGSGGARAGSGGQGGANGGVAGSL